MKPLPPDCERESIRLADQLAASAAPRRGRQLPEWKHRSGRAILALNQASIQSDEKGMTFVLSVGLVIGLLWVAYRIIRNGFLYPQSEKLGCFGVFGYFLVACLAIGLLAHLFPEYVTYKFNFHFE